MPLLKENFSPTLPFRNAFLSTVYRSLFMKDERTYERKRVVTWDEDFIDLDFSFHNSKTLVLLIHGLEGSSNSNYMVTTSKELNKNGFDTVCMNLRGCSGQDNLLAKSYHSGKTDDLDFIIRHLVYEYNYENIVLCGFSLGGNIILKYLGEYDSIPKEVKGAITISVPVDLTSSQTELKKTKNSIYMMEFLSSIKLKILQKAEKNPILNIDKDKLYKAKTFKEVEELYTVPIFGFKSSEHYWEVASSKPHIPKIKLPTLLINAKDDTFLAKECYPTKEAETSNYFYLITPKYGGHVGFINSFTAENKWMEHQIIDFIHQKLNIHNI